MGLFDAFSKKQSPVEQAGEKAKELASKGVEAYKQGFSTLEQAGYFEPMKDFNQELVRPLKQVETVSLENTRKEIFQTLKFDPSSPTVGFNLWNVIGFYLCVIEAIVAIAFDSAIISIATAAASILIGYIIAYSLYWGVLVKKKKTYCLRALLLLGAYGAYCAFSIVFSILNPIAAVLYGLKALTAILMAINGFKVYTSLTDSTSLI